MDFISDNSGPVYGVRLIDELPIGKGSMRQCMPTRKDLESARRVSERVVAGYEVLLAHYREQKLRIEELVHVGRVLLNLIDEVQIDPTLGDETDRVFPRYEFEPLRIAIEKATQT